MKLLKVIKVFAILLTCFIAFSNVYSASDTPPKKDYTIILYLNGCDLESDKKKNSKELSGEASDALKELQDATFEDSKINMIVVTGGTKKWVQKSPEISTDRCQAWIIHGDPKKKENMELCEKLPGKSIYSPVGEFMMDKETLNKYLSWAVKNFPAKKYALLMWDHGAGPIGGFGTDELNKNKSISISDIQWALQKTSDDNDKMKFDLIGFTCCLLGNYETAYKIKDLAYYMLGSEELSEGDAFSGFMKKLAEDPSMSGKDLGIAWIKAHFNENYKKEELYTFSVIDLSKIEEVKTNWKAMIEAISAKMGSDDRDSDDMYRKVAIARASSESYNEFDRAADGLTDMYHLSKLISQECVVKTSDLCSSIKKAVVYNEACKRRTNSNGLSVYFVDKKLDSNLGIEDNLTKYKLSCFSNKYYTFMNSYYDKLFVKDPAKTIGAISFTSRRLKDENNGKYPPKYLVSIDQKEVPLVSQVWFVIGKLVGSGDDKKFQTLSIDKEVNFDKENGDISIEVTGKQYCIDEEPIPIYWDGDVNSRKGKEYLPIGYFAVKFNDATKFFVVKENKDKDACDIIGVWDTKDYNGKVIPVLSWLEQKDLPKTDSKIIIQYKVRGKYVDGPEVSLKNYVIKKANLENGKYYGAFYIQDVIGRKVWSFRKNFKLDNSKIDSSNEETDDENMSDSDET